VYVEGKGTFPSYYAPGCFDRLPGQVVPWNYRETDGHPPARRLGRATIVSVEVNEDGTEATWTADFEPAAPADVVKITGEVL
jgi:hypothetical protein